MTVSRSQRALIHLAAKDRGLGDDQHRSALAQIGGVTSAKDLDAEGFTAMMGYFEYIGFAPIAAKGPSFRVAPVPCETTPPALRNAGWPLIFELRWWGMDCGGSAGDGGPEVPSCTSV